MQIEYIKKTEIWWASFAVLKLYRLLSSPQWRCTVYSLSSCSSEMACPPRRSEYLYTIYYLYWITDNKINNKRFSSAVYPVSRKIQQKCRNALWQFLKHVFRENPIIIIVHMSKAKTKPHTCNTWGRSTASICCICLTSVELTFRWNV